MRTVTVLSYRVTMTGARAYVALRLTAEDAATINHAARRLLWAAGEIAVAAPLHLAAHLEMPGVAYAPLRTCQVDEALRGLDPAREFATLEDVVVEGLVFRPVDWVALSTDEPDTARAICDTYAVLVNRECLRHYFWLQGWLVAGLPAAIARAEAELAASAAGSAAEGAHP